MYAAGVKCTDCHDAHSLKLKLEGNALCMQCHGASTNPRFPGLTAKSYDSVEHHFHPPDSPGSQCVACHMTGKRYMQVDPRRDHSFRIPRPDLSRRTQAPDACTGCHRGKDARWAENEIKKRSRADVPDLHYGEVLAKARHKTGLKWPGPGK